MKSLWLIAAGAVLAQDPVKWDFTLDTPTAPPGGTVLGRPRGRTCRKVDYKVENNFIFKCFLLIVEVWIELDRGLWLEQL